MADADKVWVPSKTKVWQLATVDAWKQSTVEVTTAEGQHETLDQAKAARWDPSQPQEYRSSASQAIVTESVVLSSTLTSGSRGRPTQVGFENSPQP